MEQAILDHQSDGDDENSPHKEAAAVYIEPSAKGGAASTTTRGPRAIAGAHGIQDCGNFWVMIDAKVVIQR